MLSGLFRRFFGSANDRFVRGLAPIVEAVNALEATVEVLDDQALSAQTQRLKARLGAGESLDQILPEAFATVREAARRTLGIRHFDVQVMGGIVLHRGMISEMATGEGKTLVATLPVYLNAISGKGVHVVTVNDYLARRDAEWMGKIYQFLGLSVGAVYPGIGEQRRKEAYAADITYGTNNEFGFDYLRDNMKFEANQLVQRDFNFAIVDEVDSILIDEARTPLVISGPAEDSSSQYTTLNAFIPLLQEDHYELDEKTRSVTLTDEGVEFLEERLSESDVMTGGSLYDLQNVDILHHVNQALRAHKVFQRDKDYLVKDGKVVIVDEFTGRMMEGRRFGEGLHQALEAREKVDVLPENQTLASITLQNYFRLYPKLAGMTGTAMTEAEEFSAIYGLDVVTIPTNLPVTRIDHDDEVYRTEREKLEAILIQIKDCQERQQPVLVGTASIEKSEQLGGLLKRAGVKHQILNARFHEQEACIVAQAGAVGAVTIATNMAGRGTDIKLGGNAEMRIQHETATVKDEAAKARRIAEIEEEVRQGAETVRQAGGLFVISSERHESRRIDNQLRGRSGRQSDPGASKFFLSLEDDLMRIFGSERMDSVLRRLGLEEGEAITHPWVSKALEKAQKKVEQRNFDIRKSVLQFDNVMNDQRRVIYEQRREIMAVENVKETVRDMRREVIEDLVKRCIPVNAYADQWEVERLHEETLRLLGGNLPVKEWTQEEGVAGEEILERLVKYSDRVMAAKAANCTPDVMRRLEQQLLLMVLDKQWKEHLLGLDHLRRAVHLRAYGQRNPLDEYKREAFDMFEMMLASVRDELTVLLHRLELQPHDAVEVPRREQEAREGSDDPALPDLNQPTPIKNRSNGASGEGEMVVSRVAAAEVDPNDPSTWGRVSRNQLCPCGSGKKYKHCHGKLV